MQDNSHNIPQYLKPNTENASYGELSFNARSKCWTIKAEPMVIEFAKRLFPGANNQKRGEIRFSDHRRIIGDINWLMIRYPLTVREKDKSRWENALKNAQDYHIQKQANKLKPKRIKPPQFAFEGELTDFQEEGLAFLESTDRCLLADEMGLGKTVQALALLARRCEYPVIIVPPAHLVSNWLNEINKFLGNSKYGIKVHVIKGLKPYDLPTADIYIAHYLLLRGWKNVLPDYAFDTVIFDEIQELRHGGTEKYSSASLLASSANRVIGLSGTPIYNNGGEIWQVINILDFNFLGNFDAFSREWCYGYGNNVVIDPAKLGNFLTEEGIMLRRRKEDVLPSLPPKRRLVTAIDSDEDVFKRWMQPIIEKLSTWNSDLSLSQRTLLAFEIDKGERQATGVAKAPYVVQFVRMLVDGGEKVLLFAHHHKVMDIYKSGLKAEKPVFITGRETTQQKQAAVEKFMSGKTNICCISLRAASGLNLQKASCVVFGELDWSPAVHSQAEDRAHRIGQQDSLLCYYLVSKEGSDQRIQDALGLKVSQFKALMLDPLQTSLDEKTNAEHAINHVNQLFEKYINKGENV